MADITLDTHYACNIIAILVNVIGIKYRFVSWIKLDHSLFECMDITLQNLLLQWLSHLFDVLDWGHLIFIVTSTSLRSVFYATLVKKADCL